MKRMLVQGRISTHHPRTFSSALRWNMRYLQRKSRRGQILPTAISTMSRIVFSGICLWLTGRMMIHGPVEKSRQLRGPSDHSPAPVGLHCRVQL